MVRIKYALLVLAVALSLALSWGCATPPPTATPAPTPTFTQTQTTPTPLPPGVLVDLPSFSRLVDAVKASVVAITADTASGQVAGSGWIIDSSGTIVTNNHVISGTTNISVQLADGTSYQPVSVKGDSVADIAVIKINAGRALPALRIADTSNIRVGDWVVIVGNALGLGISMKHGTVSRLSVSISCPAGENCTDLIETDAPINPGNSGGPMFNLSGEVIGITSLKFSAAGIEGLGYAINIAEALPTIQRLSS